MLCISLINSLVTMQTGMTFIIQFLIIDVLKASLLFEADYSIGLIVFLIYENLINLALHFY